MKKISGRAIITALLGVLVLIGLSLFVVQYFVSAREWVTFPGSPHVYSGGNISTGSIRDRDGVMVLTNGSRRVYAEDEMVRKATLHLLGDRYGNIEAPLVNAYAEKMLDYNVITGIYNSSDTGNVLNLSLSTKACTTALEALGDRRGTVGVYNYQTGEILCMVSSGTYDPDDAPSLETIESYDYYNGVYMNRFTSVTYVPGSIFKLVTAAAAIDQLEGVSGRTFECHKQTIIDGEYIICEDEHGSISFGEGLIKSCNIVFGELAEELGPEILTEYAEKAGITSSIEFDGTSTAAGNFDLTGATGGSVAWAGIGQYTDMINPCQFMTFVGSIANGGQAAKPYVVSSVETPEGINTYKAKTEMLERTMSAGTAATLAQMMRDDVVYNYGTYNFPDVYVCAKSGTAEVEGQNPNAMFAGFVQDPEYPLAFIVVVEDAGSGSAVCTSIAGDVIAACMESMDANS